MATAYDSENRRASEAPKPGPTPVTTATGLFVLAIGLLLLCGPVFQDFRVHDVDWLTLSKCDDLFEHQREHSFQPGLFHVTDMGRADDIVHREQRMVSAHHGLVIENIHG